jgi:antitoxin CptB
MLELDVLLLPFAEQKYRDLSDDDQALYRQLLDCEDPDLFTWFLEHQIPEDAGLARMVNMVLEHAQQRA